MNIFQKLVAAARRIPPLYAAGGVVVVIVGIVALHHFAAAPTSSTTPTGVSHIEVSSAADLSAQVTPLSVVGTVTSLNQATILAQTSGEIVSLPHSIGDQVAAGATIGEFQNASQEAAVVQAEGSYESAQAALAQAQGTTASNSAITAGQASSAAQNQATALQAALASAYSALDDAVHTKADALFINPNSSTPSLEPFAIPNSQLVITVNNERVELQATFASAAAAAASTDSTKLDQNAQTLLTSAQAVQNFLSDLISALNQAVPNANFPAAVVAADQASLSAARSEVNAAVSSLNAAKSSYDSASSGAQTAANSASAGTQNSIAIAQAALKSAQGALEAAQANLANTIIRSPISGTIVSLPVTQGDYVSSFSQIAVVSNPGAVYVDARITQDDAATLAVGGSATISGTAQGVITFIAPAIDPTTGKIEVKVGITGGASTLADGEAVTLSLERSAVPAAAASAALTLPVAAVQITPNGPIVFTVSASSTLVANPIVLGTILGDQVTVASGITPNIEIVTDARGLSAGQTVLIDTATSSPS